MYQKWYVVVVQWLRMYQAPRTHSPSPTHPPILPAVPASRMWAAAARERAPPRTSGEAGGACGEEGGGREGGNAAGGQEGEPLPGQDQGDHT